MKKKIFSLLTIICLLLTITISFAWMVDIDIIRGNDFRFGFGNGVGEDDLLYVAPNDVEVELEKVGNGNLTHDLISGNMAPGDILRFRVILTNKSEFDMTLNMLLSKINFNLNSSELEAYSEFLNNIYIGVYNVTGINHPYLPPRIYEDNLKNLTKADIHNVNDNLSCQFVERFILPAKAKVNVAFFIRLDSKAEAILENKQISIGKLDVMAI